MQVGEQTTIREEKAVPETSEAAPRGAPLLSVRNVSKRFGTIQALRDISFDVHRGEVVALLGDNGAGKSTLVKIISGSHQPDSGEILFDGAPLGDEGPAAIKAKGIETVYQDPSLCLNVDVVANFFMGREKVRNFLGLRILREREMQTETERVMREVGVRLPGVRVPVENLSGGQRQAIELARFVHWGGKMVLLDEPFAALGVEQTRRGLDMIERVKQQGIAVIVITHNMLHAFQVADRVVVLRHGRVTGIRSVDATTPEEVVMMITGEISRSAAAERAAG